MLLYDPNTLDHHMELLRNDLKHLSGRSLVLARDYHDVVTLLYMEIWTIHSLKHFRS